MVDIKEINKKNRIYYFFDDMINIIKNRQKVIQKH